MIPKIIHYCWFGRGPMTALEKKCLASWKKHCPDFEIKLWNEDNFDVNYCEFTKEAYRLGKFAFVSDVARLYALQQEGGVYLDTDMLLLKSIDDLLINEFFLADHLPNKIALGIIGSKKKHPIINTFLLQYQGLKFSLIKPKLIPDLFDEILGRKREKFTIYGPEFFYALPFEKKNSDFRVFITQNSYAVHLWNHSWKDEISLLNDFKFVSALYTYAKNRIKYPDEYKKSDQSVLFREKFKMKLKVYFHQVLFEKDL